MTNQLEAASRLVGTPGRISASCFLQPRDSTGAVSSPFSAGTFLILPTGSYTIHSLISILSLQILELVTLVPHQQPQYLTGSMHRQRNSV